ncbi:lysophospholipid acyltransferase family protein [Chitinimonas koreensis]|uniref:lysophospholipid acyltransferase family protein n=1 Tax=Chitinimonas koreensis TaxID=356302 RepID=UPI000429283F|nr:lysophospholipid acyltransferase family protein [Chitinimonas koreensis]QNM98226.1 1-acyl-sn-glycerol-3-phosphate acyltransferase [Chitinimonas koreensis]
MIALLRLAWRLLAIVDLVLFTVPMLALAVLPQALLRRIYPPLFHAWCRCFVRALGVELRLHQHYRGVLPERYVLIANHPSAFEDIGIPALFPVRSLAKAEVADWPLLGRIARAADTLFVRRESAESRRAASQALSDAARAGDRLALYPEGGCKGRRLAGRFFSGAFVASFDSGVPIVPVFLHYPAQETFEWGDQHLLLKLWQIGTASNPRADYHVFEPIDPGRFDSPEAMKEHAYRLYQEWERRFLA